MAAGRGPHPNGAGAACGCLAVARQQVHGHLHRQGVHVDAGRRVHAGGHGGQAGRRPAGVVALERAEVAEVEHGAEVDVEALGALAGEGLDAVAERADGVGGQVGVARRGERADVARRAGQSGPELGRPSVMPVDHLQAVGLHPVPVRARQRRDGPDVVEEEARVAQRRVEGEQERDVRNAVAVVVDVDRIEHGVVELVEVGARVGRLQRDVVGDQRDGRGIVGADERVHVRAVSHGVLGDLGSFTMGRHGSPHLVWVGRGGYCG